MASFTYRVIRSARKTLAIQIDRNGEVIVRAPRSRIACPDSRIEALIRNKEKWVLKHLEKYGCEHSADQPKLTPDEVKELARKALQVIPERVRYWAPVVGVSYGRITIRNQISRWGSCTSRGNLNFNCLLMLTPPEVLDCVVVHELCHRLQMNHSPAFRAEMTRVYPQWPVYEKWLRNEGRSLIARMP